MIYYVKGDLLKSSAEALVNPVNCVGVGGRGLALAFKKAYPENFQAYKKACDAKRLEPGKLFLSRTKSGKIIVNFPTKLHWRNPSKISYIGTGLTALVTFLKSYNVSSIAIPKLGCGLGGLDWRDVEPLIVTALKPLSVDSYIYGERISD